MFTDIQKVKTMTKPNTQIGDKVRLMTDAEYAQWLADADENETKANAQVAKAEQRQAVLNKLGLTADEAAALFG